MTLGEAATAGEGFAAGFARAVGDDCVIPLDGVKPVTTRGEPETDVCATVVAGTGTADVLTFGDPTMGNSSSEPILIADGGTIPSVLVGVVPCRFWNSFCNRT